MQIKYNGEITYQDIPGYEYAVDENALKSDSPEESCFCINQTRNINGNWSCFLDGVMDLYPCLGKKQIANIKIYILINIDE